MATLLVQNGTLKVGTCVMAVEWTFDYGRCLTILEENHQADTFNARFCRGIE
jgi:hypothetical protein